MANPTAPDSQPAIVADPSIQRRRAILLRLGRGTAVAAAVTLPAVASASALSRWQIDPSRRAGTAGRLKLGAAS